MVGSFLIRSDPSDVRGIIALFQAVYAGCYPAPEMRSVSALHSHLARGVERFFCALLDGVVVGCVSARIVPVTRCPATGEHISEIGKLCTAPDVKNRSGVAMALATAAIEASLRAGASAFYATVRSGPALRIARALGFVAVGYSERRVSGATPECHLAMLRIANRQFPHRIEPRARARQGSVYDTLLVRSVTRALELGAATGDVYPHRRRLERTARIAGGSGRDRDGYAEVLVRCDDEAKIKELQRRDWRLSAFLPAWDRLRFDCVKLSASSPNRAEPRDRVIARALSQFRAFPTHSPNTPPSCALEQEHAAVE